MKCTKNAVEQVEKTVAVAEPKVVVNPIDLQLLKANEEIISKAQSSFLEIGMALKTIRDQSQFKAAECDSFEDYCAEKWSYSLNYANRLIAAYSCYSSLKQDLATTGEVLPTNEYQLRSLAGLAETEWVKVWKRILANSAGKTVTGEMVDAAVKVILHPAVEKPTDAKAKPTAKAKMPPEAKKLVKIGELVRKALDEKSECTSDKLIKLLKKIQKMVAEPQAS